MKRSLKWILAFVGAAIVVLLLRAFAFTSFYVPSNGMEQSVLSGEGILVDKWSYGLRIPMDNWWGYHRKSEQPVQLNDVIVFNNPANIANGIGQKEVFIGQCVGTPGDTLMVDSLFGIVSNEKLQSFAATSYYRYSIQQESAIDSLMASYKIESDSCIIIDSLWCVRPFTRKEIRQLSKGLYCDTCFTALDANEQPVKPLIVPSKGKTITIYPWNRTLLMNTLVLHENKKVVLKNDTLFIDGVPSESYCFTKDYYWINADNSENLADSRLFGFVPHDHVIGQAAIIWFSKEPNTSLFNGYRWDRFFKRLN